MHPAISMPFPCHLQYLLTITRLCLGYVLVIVITEAYSFLCPIYRERRHKYFPKNPFCFSLTIYKLPALPPRLHMRRSCTWVTAELIRHTGVPDIKEGITGSLLLLLKSR